jgi:hypothetical protein
MSLKLRLKLSDFIGTTAEDDIMLKICDLHVSLPMAFELLLWYPEGHLSATRVGDFLKTWESRLKNKTRVVATDTVKFNESIFFNIVGQKYTNPKLHYNFEYVFTGNVIEGIHTGLDKFAHAVTFCYSDKTVRKQKRNDYA